MLIQCLINVQHEDSSDNNLPESHKLLNCLITEGGKRLWTWRWPLYECTIICMYKFLFYTVKGKVAPDLFGAFLACMDIGMNYRLGTSTGFLNFSLAPPILDGHF